MRIDHIALYTNDLEKLKDFYTKYFDAKPNELYHNKVTGLKTYFLSFDNGARLEIMTGPNIQKEDEKTIKTGYVHLSFGVGSKDKVDLLTTRLEKDGYTILSAPRTTGDGYYESCILDPDGNQIELVKEN